MLAIYDILFKPVSELLKLKELTQKALARMGIKTVRDLIFYIPVQYKDITNLNHRTVTHNDIGNMVQGEFVILDMMLSRFGQGSIIVGNQYNRLELKFFNPLPSFLLSKLKEGQKYIIRGKLQFFQGLWQIAHPNFLFDQGKSHDSVEPVYKLTYGITSAQVQNYAITCLNKVMDALLAQESTTLHDASQNRVIWVDHYRYMLELISDLKSLHLNELAANISENGSIKDKAKLARFYRGESLHRLKMKEIFSNQAMFRMLREQANQHPGRIYNRCEELQTKVLKNLGFELTAHQADAMSDIEREQSLPVQMVKLLQGDVGSGKTLVALLTMLNVVNHDVQCALMAPTDLLSLQHWQFFAKALAGTDIEVALLTGKTKAKERREVNAKLANGAIKILIGTHALFQDKVEFHDLGYIVIDEQHRFGVDQRCNLINKAKTPPDILSMTATPIPRSLAMTMFGDMTIAAIKQKPKNRQPIKTRLLSLEKRKGLIDFITNKIAQQERVYWICPFIEPKEQDEVHKVVATAGYRCADVVNRGESLQQIFGDDVGILHGKLSAKQKEEIMQQFKSGMLKILVSTTVIEVGIDVPEATVIVIENAEKFGLAQLHQLRGRVGRGEKKSEAILLYNKKSLTMFAQKRLELMRSSDDGFHLAEEDLKLRGSGELLGTKQSGDMNFYFFSLENGVSEQDSDISVHYSNQDILYIADQDAAELFNKDLTEQERQFLKLQGKIFAREARPD